MTELIRIDGSQGEGGGQIVRSSLALSMITGRGFQIDRLRAGRTKPGLLRQHLTAVRAASALCGGIVQGDSIGSSELRFEPGRVQPGDYEFSVGTAGSATLVLQTVLPPLLIAGGPSRLVLEGGTHNPWAPPFDFLAKAYLPLAQQLGPQVNATLERPGFYPAGGGRFVVEVIPVPQLKSLTLLERGAVRQRRARVLHANLPEHVALRELEQLKRLTGWEADLFSLEVVTASGPGNVTLLEVEHDHVTEVFVGFGEYGVKAEEVARRAVQAWRDYLATQVPVGPYLADQLLLLLGISVWQTGTTSLFRTLPLTRHATTQIDILQTFLGIKIDVRPVADTTAVDVVLGPC